LLVAAVGLGRRTMPTISQMSTYGYKQLADGGGPAPPPKPLYQPTKHLAANQLNGLAWRTTIITSATPRAASSVSPSMRAAAMRGSPFPRPPFHPPLEPLISAPKVYPSFWATPGSKSYLNPKSPLGLPPAFPRSVQLYGCPSYLLSVDGHGKPLPVGSQEFECRSSLFDPSKSVRLLAGKLDGSTGL